MISVETICWYIALTALLHQVKQCHNICAAYLMCCSRTYYLVIIVTVFEFPFKLF